MTVASWRVYANLITRAPAPAFDNAACAEPGIDVNTFYPTPETDNAEAKAICASCPHRWACLMWALSTAEPYGTFGGYSAPERELMRRGKLAVA